MSNNFDNDPVSYRRAGDVAVDAGLRIFFRSVYNYMIAGLALTGVVGYGVAFFAFQDGSPLGAILYGSPVAYVVMFAPLVLSLIFGGRIYTMRPATAQIIFWLFAALMGVALSSIMAFAVGTVGRTVCCQRDRHLRSSRAEILPVRCAGLRRAVDLRVHHQP